MKHLKCTNCGPQIMKTLKKCVVCREEITQAEQRLSQEEEVDQAEQMHNVEDTRLSQEEGAGSAKRQHRELCGSEPCVSREAAELRLSQGEGAGRAKH